MLEKDPAKRISAKDALNHIWLNQDENQINDQRLDVANALEEDKDQHNKVDYSKLNDADEDEVQLVSCTPVMAKRNLRPNVPETPFLKVNKLDRQIATPMMAGGIVI